MKKALSRLIAAFLLLGLLGAPAFAQTRLATIDLRKVFDNYWKRKQADAAVKERAAEMEKEHTGMVAEWKKAKDEYQSLLASANDQAVSSEEREKRKKTAEDKLKEIKATEDTITQYEKTARTRIEEQLKRMRENILGEIRAVINGKAQSGNYNLVIDTAAETVNNTPVVLYSSTKDGDLTEEVLKQLNATAPPEPAKTDEKKK